MAALATLLVLPFWLLLPGSAWACACASNSQGDRTLLLVGLFLLLPPALVLWVVREVRQEVRREARRAARRQALRETEPAGAGAEG